jgi:uncharacterized surface protein with fasciclin (FAS1) repeats
MANIVDTAAAAGSFKTLLAAVEAAGLKGALSGTDKLTVFAPTDAAFAKLPKGTVEALLKDIPKLKNILLFHVVKGEVNPNRNGKTFDTLLMGGDSFPKEISVKVTVGEPVQSLIWGGQDTPAVVVTAGVKADNGVIHVIDEVLIPYEGNITSNFLNYSNHYINNFKGNVAPQHN